MQSMKRWLLVLSVALLTLQHVRADFQVPLLSGEVEAEIKLEGETVSLTREVMATLNVWMPANLNIEMPAMDTIRGRFQGFSLAEGFERVPEETPDGRKKVSMRWRLMGDPAAERYRLAPFAITIKDAVSGLEIRNMATSPVLFPLASLPDAAGDVEINPKRFFVWPTAQTWLRWSLWTFIGIVAIFLLLWGIKQLKKAIRLHRMTPRERALAELEELLERKLVAKGLFKDFYIELTHVVRRYIERAYCIRAPRLTTEEFLETAKTHPHFTAEAVERLSAFLQSADMVKFAGVTATPEVCDGAAGEARRYIDWDCELMAKEKEFQKSEDGNERQEKNAREK